MATKPFDPLEGVNTKTTRTELMDKLRKTAALLRRQDNQKKKQLAEIEDRIRAKREASGATQEELRQSIFSMTDPEWVELIEFLEEFEDLAPIGARRLIAGGRVLLGQIPEPDESTV